MEKPIKVAFIITTLCIICSAIFVIGMAIYEYYLCLDYFGDFLSYIWAFILGIGALIYVLPFILVIVPIVWIVCICINDRNHNKNNKETSVITSSEEISKNKVEQTNYQESKTENDNNPIN